ncbi:hypothetical protein OAG1_01680 [Agarivorans sp. OAG1]|uniref:lysozyme inhibitor LprI family protein n=1 Tax=Agarivorans sp. OAG1 TaxID=3082387 RepID=UPI002B28428D|nr:hypothetical protein OAG1_01680 [Agarivorans sp. OAG1]
MKKRNWIKVISVCLVLFSGSAFSIDNPDAPNYLGEFEITSGKYEVALSNSDSKNVDFISEYADYHAFLDKELNKAYTLLKTALNEEEFKSLKASQRKWIAFRDSELQFINENWNRVNFGSSYNLSRNAYKAELVKARITQLYQYAKNYN